MHLYTCVCVCVYIYIYIYIYIVLVWILYFSSFLKYVCVCVRVFIYFMYIYMYTNIPWHKVQKHLSYNIPMHYVIPPKFACMQTQKWYMESCFHALVHGFTCNYHTSTYTWGIPTRSRSPKFILSKNNQPRRSKICPALPCINTHTHLQVRWGLQQFQHGLFWNAQVHVWGRRRLW